MAPILWINDPNKLPGAIRDKLKSNKVLIKSLNDIDREVERIAKDGIISQRDKKNYKVLSQLVHFYVEQSDFGTATDITRYLAMFLYGGLYIDGDYKIENIGNIEKLMGRYDSFFGVERYWDTRLGNAFLVSKKYGKVIKGVLDLSYRNTLLNIAKVPPYIQYPAKKDMGVIFRTGPIALTVAVAKYGTQEKVGVLEYCSIFSAKRL